LGYQRFIVLEYILSNKKVYKDSNATSKRYMNNRMIIPADMPSWKKKKSPGRKYGRYDGFEVLVRSRIGSGSQICKDFPASSKIDRDSDISPMSHFHY
jgi:hypothetical protein